MKLDLDPSVNALAQISAEAILAEHLDRRQQREWKKDGSFRVHVRDRVYCIRPSRDTFPVEVEKPGDADFADETNIYRGAHLGLHRLVWMPDADYALTLKLRLEAGERRLLRTACR